MNEELAVIVDFFQKRKLTLDEVIRLSKEIQHKKDLEYYKQIQKERYAGIVEEHEQKWGETKEKMCEENNL